MWWFEKYLTLFETTEKETLVGLSCLRNAVRRWWKKHKHEPCLAQRGRLKFNHFLPKGFLLIWSLMLNLWQKRATQERERERKAFQVVSIIHSSFVFSFSFRQRFRFGSKVALLLLFPKLHFKLHFRMKPPESNQGPIV